MFYADKVRENVLYAERTYLIGFMDEDSENDYFRHCIGLSYQAFFIYYVFHLLQFINEEGLVWGPANQVADKLLQGDETNRQNIATR